MSNFAKLFNTEKYGQIAVIKQGSDEKDGEEVRLFFQPLKMGVCSIAMSFDDSDEGYEACDNAFDKIDADLAGSIIDKPYSQFS